jgi:epsilon-lactone hydrolase
MPSPEHERVVAALLAARPTQPPDVPPSMAETRAGFDKMMQTFLQPLPPDVRCQPVDAGGVDAEWIETPDSERARVVLWLHGGGYSFGSLASYRELAARVARAARARCLLVDYRLAPEHPFPAAIQDATAAYRWLLRQEVSPRRLVIAGDSAGGGLTLGALVALQESGEPLPAAAICLSPLTDLEATGASLKSVADDPLLTGGPQGILAMAHAYVQNGSLRDPRASPLHADYAGFPPLLIQVGTREALLDDSTRLAERARAAGVQVSLEKGDGLIHVWPLFAPRAPESLAALASLGAFVQRHAA